MPTDLYRDEKGTLNTRQVKSDDDIASAAARSRFSTTAGSGLGAKGSKGKGPMPQQKDFSSTSAWQAALREWRAQPDAAADGQKKALARMGK